MVIFYQFSWRKNSICFCVRRICVVFPLEQALPRRPIRPKPPPPTPGPSNPVVGWWRGTGGGGTPRRPHTFLDSGWIDSTACRTVDGHAARPPPPPPPPRPPPSIPSCPARSPPPLPPIDRVHLCCDGGVAGRPGPWVGCRLVAFRPAAHSASARRPFVFVKLHREKNTPL